MYIDTHQNPTSKPFHTTLNVLFFYLKNIFFISYF